MKIYSMNITSIDPNDEKWYDHLSPRRIEKVNRLKQTQKKAQSIGAELLLRHAVKEIAGENKNMSWDTDESGKPYLTDYPEIHVNISHSGGWAVCAVHNAPVGIDIQQCREFDERLTDRFFTSEEAEYVIKNGDKTAAFYSVWTRKESFLKAVGKGITVPLDSFSVLGDEIIYEGNIYKFREYRVKESGYKLSVCFASSGISSAL